MKILFLAPQPFFESRGTPINVKNIITVLGEKDFQIDLLTYPLGKDLTIKNVKIIRTIRIPFIKEVKIGPSYTKVLFDAFLFIKAIKLCLKNKYKVIHAVEESVYIGLVLNKLFKIPLIYDMDSNIPQQLSYSKFFKNRLLLRIAERIDAVAINNSKLVLTVCSDLTEYVVNKFPGKKVFQVEDVPVINDDNYQKSVHEIKRELNLDQEKVVLYTGNFEKYQGIDLLIQSIPKVLKEFKKVRFVLIGGDKRQIDEKNSLAKELGVTKSTIFTGKKPVEEINSYMSVADILVSPRTEGTNTPLKIYSYLDTGKPVVATKLKTHTQVLNDDVAMLAEPNSASFAKGIISLLENEELQKKIGEKGKSLIEDKYSFEKFSEKIARVYNYLDKNVREEE